MHPCLTKLPVLEVTQELMSRQGSNTARQNTVREVGFDFIVVD